MTTVLTDPAAFRAACDEARRTGLRVGVVPTMGALHEGHLALVDEARRRAGFVVVTVFVNPLQFGPHEDFGRYPRTLEADVEGCRARGVDVVFAPPVDAMVPAGFTTAVEVTEITDPLEGSFRPGHFRGVTTIVAKLFNLVGPSVAVFGRKDLQQVMVITRMTEELGFPVEVVAHPTVRETDGLALSSRNRYLSADDRVRALAIAQGLSAAHDAYVAGERGAEALEALARAPIEAQFDAVDYVAVVDLHTLRPPAQADTTLAVVVAARVGTTRLIDNLVLGRDARPLG